METAIRRAEAWIAPPDISSALIVYLERLNKKDQDKISNLEQQKQKNLYAEETYKAIHSIPPEKTTEKIMRYERFLQKSINQHIELIEKLQSGK